MKKATNFLILLLGSGMLHAQVNYTDINPDAIIDIATDSYETLKMDIDGDQLDDILWVATNYPSFALWNLGAQQLDTNNAKIEFLVDVSISASPIGDNYMKMLSAGDAIDATGSYSSDYPQVGDVYNTHFLGQGSTYIGFRLISGSDYKYGWLGVELSGSGDMTFTLRDFAYNNTVNTSITAGSGSLSTSNFEISQPFIWTYPNPASMGFDISCLESCELESVEVYSLDGKLMYENHKPSLPLHVDAGSWKISSYILKIKDANGDWHTNRWVKY